MNDSQILAWLKKKRVAVLMGGWSRERSISLKTGAAVLASLRRQGVKALGIDVGFNIDRVLSAKKVQFAFIALHGTFGEDGGIQSVLDTLRIPYTGSGPLGSALAMDKELSKRAFVQKKVPTPAWITLFKSDFKSNAKASLAQAWRFLKGGPLFCKPVDQGSAIGVSRVTSRRQLLPAIKKCFTFSEGALLERFVPGREITVGILGKKALPVVEIVPEHAFYDYHSKYARGGSRHIVPARLSRNVSSKAQRISLAAFRAVSAEAYGRVDLMVAKSGAMFVLEVNTIPGMTDTSLLPDAARAAKINFDSLVLKIAALSL